METENGKTEVKKKVTRIEINGELYKYVEREEYDESTYFDGRNLISRATGDQFIHETLYIMTLKDGTKQAYIYHYSQWQGSRSSRKRVDKDETELWLTKNKYDDEQIDDIIAELEYSVSDNSGDDF